MRLLFGASGRFPNDQRREGNVGLDIEVRSFDLLQNIFSRLYSHIVDRNFLHFYQYARQVILGAITVNLMLDCHECF